MMIRLIVGLGNPGREYADTRHNAGFWCVDTWARKLGIGFSLESKYFAELARTKIGQQDLFLLKPQTYMNLSGKSVQALASFYKIQPEEILVVHDELDLLPGEIRVKQGGGNAGHNGLKDIAAHLTPNFWRLRLGVGHPRSLGLKQNVADFVLHPPRLEEMPALEQALQRSLNAWSHLAAGEFPVAQRLLHAKAP